MTIDAKIAEFRRLHDEDCFILPNPWDAGSAKYLESLGFSALATSSAGLGFAIARPDLPQALDRDVTLRNVQEIVEATSLPVNADFQAGHGVRPQDVSESVSLCVETGVAGLSIEDATGDPNRPLYALPEALERLTAAREAIEASGRRVVLTARAECFLVGHEDPLAESLKRLTAYAEAGADCLYAPGAARDDEIRAIVDAVAPKPINVLAVDPARMTRDRLASLGVRRISVGSALARTAWSGFMHAARELTGGSFRSLEKAASFDELNEMFMRDWKERS